MVSFRTMQHHDFKVFMEYFITNYTTEIAVNYRLIETYALLQAQREIESSFPGGEKTQGQVLLCITQVNANE